MNLLNFLTPHVHICTYIYIHVHVGRSHQRIAMLDERTLTKRLLGGSYRDGEDGEQQTPSGSSTPGRKIPTTPLSSNSTKNVGNSVVSGVGVCVCVRERERERETVYTRCNCAIPTGFLIFHERDWVSLQSADIQCHVYIVYV